LRSKLKTGGPPILDLLPTPVFQASDDDTLLFGETRLPGVLAWTLAQGADAVPTRDAALKFLDDIRLQTNSAIPAGCDRIEALFSADLLQIQNATFVSPETRRLLGAELVAIRDVFYEAGVEAHASHGDFGPGNLLVDPKTGRLQGVIDWDTARMTDLPGIDRLNFEIQLQRSKHSSFDRSVAAVWQSGLARDSLAGFSSERTRRALFEAAVLRYIIRSLRYPSVYREEAPEFARALEWLRRFDLLIGATVSAE